MNNEQSEEKAPINKEEIEKQIRFVIRQGKALRRRRINSMRCGGKTPRR